MLYYSYYNSVCTLGGSSFRILSSGCTCPNYTLVYECTIVSTPGRFTIWTGSAFDCPNSGNAVNLFHSGFGEAHIHRECNNGVIVVWSVGVKNNSYTSQLKITVGSDLIGKDIECIHESLVGSTRIGYSLLNMTTSTHVIDYLIVLCH